ncbi:ATP-binding cassette domain-containing protein [Ferrimicrobium sp.]|uniref:ATP-binding cassette domain-containing protein n=1 Tax=Ferrimicrobium sp. TaxID=2926050 RepID=UPI002628218A|nr:ATP-binding cassette domain-containing protein [Ferrimicrobium sp.]
MLAVDFLITRHGQTIEYSYEARSGRRLGIFGPSGAGKTTAIEVTAGLATPKSGSVTLDGRLLTQVGTSRTSVLLPPHERRIGLISQRPQLFPHLSVRENLLYGKGQRTLAPLLPMIERLELGPLLSARPSQLSGGEAQRVSIARTLGRSNQVLLLDEPFQGLDDRLRRELLLLLDDLLGALEIPVVLVAHELELVAQFADDLIVIENGRALGSGSLAALLREPATVAMAKILGYTTFVTIHGSSRIGVHPERVIAEADPTRGCVVPVTVLSTRDVGTGVRYRLRLGDQELVVTFADHRLDQDDQPRVTVLDPPVYGHDGRCLGRWSSTVAFAEDGGSNR